MSRAALTAEDRRFLDDLWDEQRRQPRRAERTGVRCIICYQPEYSGRPIAHTRGCVEYQPGRPRTADPPRRGVCGRPRASPTTRW